MKIKFLLLVLLVLFLVWSAFQPNGVLITIRHNIWSLNLVNHLLTASGQINRFSLPPTNPHSAILISRQAIKEKQFQFAEQSLLHLLVYQDRAVQGTYAEILYSIGRKREAFKIWENLNETIILERAANQSSGGGNDQHALEAYRSLYRLDPEKYTSSLTFTLKTQGQQPEAEQIILSSRAEYPNSKYRSDWLRYLADIYVANGDWQQAENVYLQTIQEHPSDLRAWRNLGLLYSSQLNMPDKAIDCYQEMVSLSPGESYSYFLLAQSYEKIGDIENALLTYQTLLLVSPDDPTALQAVERLTSEENSNP